MMGRILWLAVWFVFLATTLSFHGTVYSLDRGQKRLLDNDVFYYNHSDEVASNPCRTEGTDLYPIRLPRITNEEKLASAIDDYIENREPNSPFVGMGKYFVEGGARAGVNPLLVVAHAVHESSLGTDDTGPVRLANNAFGRTASSSQPSVTTNRDWYKWDSWEASLYSSHFPASGVKSEPDDIFQYILRKYGDNFDNGLESYLEGAEGVDGYAPTSDGNNNVPRYIEVIKTVTADIVELADGSIDLSSVSLGDQDCLGGGDIINTVLSYAWPDYREPPYTTKKPEYDEAISTAVAQGEYVGGGQYPGVDCGGFVTRVMRDSQYDPSYNSYDCNTTCQKRYLEESWQRIDVTSTADLQPGDVAIVTAGERGSSSGHTFIYVGEVPGFETFVASSSYSITGRSWRAPMAGVEKLLDPKYTWYRR